MPLPKPFEPVNTAPELLALPRIRRERQSRPASRKLGIEFRKRELGEALFVVDDSAAFAHGCGISANPHSGNHISASAASVALTASGEPTSNHSPWCTTPQSRPASIARVQKRLVEKGPSGQSRITRGERIWMPI